jgi:hypothetical protein
MNRIRALFTIKDPGKPTRSRQLRASLALACLFGSLPVSLAGHELVAGIMVVDALLYMVVGGFLNQMAFQRDKKEAQQ